MVVEPKNKSALLAGRRAHVLMCFFEMSHLLHVFLACVTIDDKVIGPSVL